MKKKDRKQLKKKRQKVVVTGGAGFVGTNLANFLREEGFKVVRVDRKSGNDITDLASMRRCFKGARFVFHTAAIPRVPYSIEHPLESNHANVHGTLSVLCAARDAGVERVIFSSSSSVYGDVGSRVMKENMSSHPISPYAMQKYFGERYCRLFSEIYGLSTVSLRYFNVYGPHMDAQESYALAIPVFIDMRLRGKPITITGDGKNTRDYTHVRDVVRANLLAATSKKVGKGEIINIGSGRNVHAKFIAKLVGGPTVHIAPRLEPRHTHADNTLAKKLLGWKPIVTLEEGVEELKRFAGLE